MEHARITGGPTEISLPYGTDTISFSLGEPHELIRLKQQNVKDADLLLSQALRNPISAGSLKDFVAGVQSLLIIVSDGTRPGCTPQLLEHIHPIIRNHGDVQFLIATGSHPPPGESGMKRIFGSRLEEYLSRYRITAHDARAQEENIYVGTTTRGTEVSLNRRVIETDGIICIGNVKPHYFAGFTGGRKSIVPGVAGFRTIEMNHSLAVEEDSQPMNLRTNPLAQDLAEAMSLLRDTNIFSIQTVADHTHSLAGCFCGDLARSFGKAAEMARELYSIPIRSKGNIVITANPYPMDINLYQSQHALENVKHITEEGGIIILVSRCWAGVGNPAYLELLDRERNRERLERIIGEGYRLGDHKALRFLKMAEKAELWAVTELEDSYVERSMMKPYHDIQSAVDDAVAVIRKKGREPDIRILPEGGITLPYLSES